MSLLSGIQQGIDYIEKNLTTKIEFEKIAETACTSTFHFQRIFSILSGYTVGEYIRNRRLSEAANELLISDSKIIDIALKYSYDTPESFSRAFKKFHGCLPSEVKSGKNVKTFSRLTLTLMLTGGFGLEYRIEKKDCIKVICKRKRVQKPVSFEDNDITTFWHDCTSDGSIQRLLKYFPEKPSINGLLGICFSFEQDKGVFPYGIGVEYDGKKITDDDFVVVELPKTTWAVFTCKGKIPESFHKTYKRIISEFFSEDSKYEYGECAELEVYPNDNVTKPDYTCEIWISIKVKGNA